MVPVRSIVGAVRNWIIPGAKAPSTSSSSAPWGRWRSQPRLFRLNSGISTSHAINRSGQASGRGPGREARISARINEGSACRSEVGFSNTAVTESGAAITLVAAVTTGRGEGRRARGRSNRSVFELSPGSNAPGAGASGGGSGSGGAAAADHLMPTQATNRTRRLTRSRC